MGRFHRRPNLPGLHPLQASEVVAEYIHAQRDTFERLALPLTRQQAASMAGFYSGEVLQSARITVFVGMKLENPLFNRRCGKWD